MNVARCTRMYTGFLCIIEAKYMLQIKLNYTRSLTLALDILILRITWLRGTGTGIELRCKKSNMARFWCTLSILISRFFTFTLNHPVRGLANDSLSKTLSPGIYFCSLFARHAEPYIPFWRQSPPLPNFQNEHSFRKGCTITEWTFQLRDGRKGRLKGSTEWTDG
jgi:uncharacterized membrane protein